MDKYRIIQTDILKEFHEFCIANNLSYTLAYGTALGAVRHKGYIPWDDDIDVMMPREDYTKFCKLYKGRGQYFLQTYETEKEYPLSYAKLRNSETTFIEKELATLRINHGIFVDIFPLDYSPSNRLSRTIVLLKAHIKRGLCFTRTKLRSSLFKKILATLIKIGTLNCHKNIIKLFDTHKDRRQNAVGYIDLCYAGPPHLYPLSIFKDRILIKFEGNDYYISSAYDEMLRSFYGNYMQLPPLSEQMSGHEAIHIDTELSYKNIILTQKTSCTQRD